MGDAFSKARPGETFRPSAKAWNRIIDQVAIRPRLESESSADPHINFRVRCRNNTTTGISRWCVMQIGGVLETPTGSWSQFEAWPGVVGVVPSTASESYVVAVEPIPVGAIGHAAIDGVVQARVIRRCTGHQYAKPVASQLDYLETAEAGPFRILHVFPTGPANPTGVTGPTRPWALLAFDRERPIESIPGYATGSTQMLGHGPATTGASGCDGGQQWYTVTECSGNPSYATSYFL